MPTLDALHRAEGIDVSLVLTNPPRPAGRGARMTPTAVAERARALGVPLVQADGARAGEGYEALASLAPDLIVVVAYGELLTAPVLGLPRLGCVNVHFSLLPRWRGAAPVQHAILAGDVMSGVSIMRMDEGLDTGPLLAAAPEPIAPQDDAGSLGARLAAIGAALAVEVAHALASGSEQAWPQDGSAAVAAPKLGPQDRVIDWEAPAQEIERRVRALAPSPGAATTFRDGSVKILKVRVRPGEGAPGRILPGEAEPLVGTGAGAVEILELAPAGRRRMSGAAWARGARPGPDERFG